MSILSKTLKKGQRQNSLTEEYHALFKHENERRIR